MGSLTSTVAWAFGAMSLFALACGAIGIFQARAGTWRPGLFFRPRAPIWPERLLCLAGALASSGAVLRYASSELLRRSGLLIPPPALASILPACFIMGCVLVMMCGLSFLARALARAGLPPDG